MVFISQERYNELTNIELKYNILNEENEELKFNLDGMTCDRDAKEEEIDKLMDKDYELNGFTYSDEGLLNEAIKLQEENDKLKEKIEYLDEERFKKENEINKINRKMNTTNTLMKIMEKQQQEWADYCEKLKEENNEFELKIDELDKCNEDNFNEKELMKDIVQDLKEENEELKRFKETCEETCSSHATVQSIMDKLEKAKNQVYEKEQAIRKYAKNKRINKHKINGFDALYNNYNNVIKSLGLNYNNNDDSDDDEEYNIDNEDIINEIEELIDYKVDAERLMGALGAEDIDQGLDMIDELLQQ